MTAIHIHTGATCEVVGVYKRTFAGVIIDSKGTGWKPGVRCSDLSKKDWNLILDWSVFESFTKALSS